MIAPRPNPPPNFCAGIRESFYAPYLAHSAHLFAGLLAGNATRPRIPCARVREGATALYRVALCGEDAALSAMNNVVRGAFPLWLVAWRMGQPMAAYCAERAVHSPHISNHGRVPRPRNRPLEGGFSIVSSEVFDGTRKLKHSRRNRDNLRNLLPAHGAPGAVFRKGGIKAIQDGQGHRGEDSGITDRRIEIT